MPQDTKETVILSQHSAVRMIHGFAREADYRLPAHIHSFFHFNLVLSGSVEVTTDAGTVTVSAGECFVMPPMVRHSLYSENGYRQIGVDLQKASDEYGIFPLAESAFQSHASVLFMPQLKEEYLLLPAENVPALQAFLLHSFAEKLIYKAVFMKKGRAPSEFKSRLLGYLNSCDKTPSTVLELQRALFISKTHLERLMHREFGMSALAFLNARRVADISAALVAENTPISVLAQRFGFCDAAHFTTFFKKHTGKTPTEFRKNA